MKENKGQWLPVAAKSYPSIEEYKTRNREAREKKRTQLAEQIANRMTVDNCETIIEIAEEIKELAAGVQKCKERNVKTHFLTIIELQNHIHELQSYLVRIEETAVGMHD